MGGGGQRAGDGGNCNGVPTKRITKRESISKVGACGDALPRHAGGAGALPLLPAPGLAPRGARRVWRPSRGLPQSGGGLPLGRAHRLQIRNHSWQHGFGPQLPHRPTPPRWALGVSTAAHWRRSGRAHPSPTGQHQQRSAPALWPLGQGAGSPPPRGQCPSPPHSGPSSWPSGPTGHAARQTCAQGPAQRGL